jgi:hypothetical protein
MQLLPCEALALMNKIDLGDDVLEKMGVDKNDDLTVTGVKFMMVDTGMDEDTVRLVSTKFRSSMVLASRFHALVLIFVSDYRRRRWRNGGR